MPALPHSRPRAALHQVEQDALADAAVGDAQPADRPGGADRVEDGAAAQHQIGAFLPDDPADTMRIVSSTAKPVAIDHDEDGDE